MKLYLSSYRIPDLPALIKLVGKLPADTRLAVIPNAKDYYADRARTFKIKNITDYLNQRGYQPEIVDLRDYDNAETLQVRLAAYDLLWVTGGNTFMLRHEMRRSGFEAIIGGLLQSGLVYGGESAGAVVAGNSLRGIEHADDAEFSESMIWEGLGLVDYFILPHIDSVQFAAAVELAQLDHARDQHMEQLTDSQALIVDGNSHKIV